MQVTSTPQGDGADGTPSLEQRGGFKVERWVIALVLVAMSLFTLGEVLGRSALGAGIPGGLLYTQHLTLWVGFLGALLATATGGHLSLATGSLFRGETIRKVVRFASDTLAAGVCFLLCVASYKMVRADMAHTGVLPGGIPEWWSECIMPVALLLIALRFVHRASDAWAFRGLSLLVAASFFFLSFAETIAPQLLVPGALALAVGLVLGTPVFIGMAGVAMLLFFSIGTPIAAVPTETFRLVANPSLPAIPLLTATGYVLAEGGASRRFLRLARAWFGWMPGGMGVMVCLVCAVFTTFTGGSGVTLLALGGIVLPMLTSEKYDEDFSLGLVTASGSLGLLFPPSLPVILYAIVAGASISELYYAGLVPGLLMVVLVATYAIYKGKRSRVIQHKFVLKDALRATWDAKWELAIPILVVISVMGAWATIVESSGLALVAAIIIESWVVKDLHPTRQLPGVLAQAGTLVGAVLIVLGVATGLASYLVEAEVPRAVVDWTTTHIRSPWFFLLVLNLVLLAVGSVVEIYAAIVLLAPLIAPMAAAYHLDPLHLGIVFLANLELGFLLPPMGLNLILASSRFNQPLLRLYKIILPFLAILAGGLLLVTYVPAMTVGVVEKIMNRPAHQAGPLAPVDKPDAGEPGKPGGTDPENFDWDAE